MYLTRSYYEKWFLRNQNLLIERGLIDADEVAAGHALRPAKNLTRGPFCTRRYGKGHQTRLVIAGRRRRPRSSKSATACARKTSTRRRTRVCRATRAATSAWSSACTARTSFPDSAAAGKGEDPQWLYTVRFDAQELWGADAEPKLKVSIEAFEPYLEHA